ncbi:hypothetical protein [Fictibacillus sp. FJAT-27399]|uniref:hypothetical protein n=1 Tax=Fictibacillus sp. FJAT-27399 TaxID=1729689 RepID=UPI0007848236|nr:hypothetical protein [Fictibacillus sp. FJAT-27399]
MESNKKEASAGLVELIGESPVPDKGREYGVMVYYYNAKKRRRLLSAAPRRKHDHIHIVIFSHLSREILASNQFDLGNSKDPQPDIKIHSKEEITRLINLIKQHWQKFK